MKRQLRLSAVWLGACALVLTASMASPAVAGPYNYTIIQNQSQVNLTASGDLLGGAMTVTEQFPSDVTRYNGTLKADFPVGPGPSGNIVFTGGSTATADVLRGGFLNLPRSVVPGVGGSGSGSAANYGILLSAPVGIEIPEFDIPDFGPVSLGTLQSVDIQLALRDVVLDVTTSGAGATIGAGGLFDASGTTLNGVQMGIASGFADIRGAVVLKQDNILTAIALYAALQGLVSQYPDLGLTVGQNLAASEVTLGFGSRVDLAGIPDLLTLANSPTTDGTVSYNPATGASTLLLPINTMISLDDVGLPAGLLELDLSLDGQLVATAIVPEPSSMMLAGLGLASVVAWSVRRRRTA